jgi:hypothetical protein
VAGETDRQLAKNAPIDMNQTVKQVPNTPPGGGGRPYSSGFRTREVQIPKVRWRTALQYARTATQYGAGVAICAFAAAALKWPGVQGGPWAFVCCLVR